MMRRFFGVVALAVGAAGAVSTVWRPVVDVVGLGVALAVFMLGVWLVAGPDVLGDR